MKYKDLFSPIFGLLCGSAIIDAIKDAEKRTPKRTLRLSAREVLDKQGNVKILRNFTKSTSW